MGGGGVLKFNPLPSGEKEDQARKMGSTDVGASNIMYSTKNAII